MYLNAYLMKILHMLQAFPSIISNYIAKKLKVMRLITNRFFFLISLRLSLINVAIASLEFRTTFKWRFSI